MILNNLEIIDTELGNIPVILNEVNENGSKFFDGKVLYDDMKIYIRTTTKESCLIGLKNAFDTQMHFWLKKQLTETSINY